MKQKLFYLIILVNVFNTACTQNKGQVSVEQIPSNYSTILYADLKKEKLEGAKFFLTFNITNSTDKEVSVGIPEYIYKGKYARELFRGWKTAIAMYFDQDGSMKAFGTEEAEGFEKLEKTPRQYIFATSHRISKDSLVQSIFSSYLEKMKIENKDTLHVGTISELKKQNSPIVQLLEGDSIIISFRGRDDLYRDPIPVQMK